MQWVRAQTVLIKTLQKETSNPDAPLHNAQPSCGTSVAFQFKGTFPKQKVEFFKNVLKQFCRKIFFVTQQHNMARYGTLFFKNPSQKNNYFIF